jgi:hypothetical protein
MPTVSASWLTKGYFVLRNDRLMRDVRDILERSLRVPQGSLHVRMYPEEENKWKHTVWWRRGRAPYREAQLFVQLARAYPVLSVGLAVEKGYPSLKVAKHPARRMDSTWDWHRLMARAGTILGDVRPLAKRLQQPVTLRVTRTPVSGEGSITDAYSFAAGNWYERYQGHADKKRIIAHLKEVDGMDDHWAIVHLACDLSPAQADGLTAVDVARTLITFDEIRRHLRGR